MTGPCKAVLGAFLACASLLSTADAPSDCQAQEPAKTPALGMVVMDPLAAPLACDCVKGFAQRKYEKPA